MENQTKSGSKTDHLLRESLLKAIAGLEQAFSSDDSQEAASYFADDAHMMWPGMADIVGREAIEAVFKERTSQVLTKLYKPEREIIDICGRRAYTLGTFIEIHAPLAGGVTEKVHGRLLEIWQLSEANEWKVLRLMTGRTGENEILK